MVRKIDARVTDRIKSALEESILTLSRETFGILKILSKVVTYCNQPASNERWYKADKLETWLTNFECLNMKVRNAFLDILRHLELVMEPEGKAKLENELFKRDQDRKPLMEILKREDPVLKEKEEIQFLLSLINFSYKPTPGVVEQQRRPDGGLHVVSKSLQVQPTAAAVSVPTGEMRLIDIASVATRGSEAYKNSKLPVMQLN